MQRGRGGDGSQFRASDTDRGEQAYSSKNITDREKERGSNWRQKTTVTYHRNYCTECSWSASTETHSQYEAARRAIEHFQKTQHTIESEPIAELDKISLSEKR